MKNLYILLITLVSLNIAYSQSASVRLIISGNSGSIYIIKNTPGDVLGSFSGFNLDIKASPSSTFTTVGNPYGMVSFSISGGQSIQKTNTSTGFSFNEGVQTFVYSFTFTGTPIFTVSDSYVEINSTEVSSSASVVLPITIQSFTAKKVAESSSLLEWTTASEEDAESMDIERSFDAKTWTKLATQQAVGGLNLSTDYSYLDKDVVLQRSEGATAYYRLYLRDKDGSGKYSDVRSVAFDPITGINFVAYPNPANTNLQLKLQMVSDQPSTQVNILDISGKLVQKANVSTNGITNIDVSNFAKGLYHLQMIHNDQVVVRKVVVN
jgi:hypothetical protein